jgi:hypothetical protein
MTPDEIRQRGEHARQLLEDELLTEAFDLAERQVLLAWENTGADQATQREWAWQLFKAVKIQRGILIAFLRQGKDAATVEVQRAMALEVA